MRRIKESLGLEREQNAEWAKVTKSTGKGLKGSSKISIDQTIYSKVLRSLNKPAASRMRENSIQNAWTSIKRS